MIVARDTQLVIGPNASMTTRMAWIFLGTVCMTSFGIAGVFALRGFWPILPFAGLEVAALAAALWVSLRCNRYREVIAFDERSIRVEFGVLGGGARLRVEWPRSSTRVLIEHGPHRHDPTRLVLSNAGRQLEMGRCLTDEDRERLAARLRELIHPAWRRAAVNEVESARFHI